MRDLNNKGQLPFKIDATAERSYPLKGCISIEIKIPLLEL